MAKPRPAQGTGIGSRASTAASCRGASVRAVRRPTIRTAAVGRRGNRVLRTLRLLAVRADRRPAKGTAAAGRYRDRALRTRGCWQYEPTAAQPKGQLPPGAIGHRALRTLRWLAVRADRRPAKGTAAGASRYGRGLAVGCAGSQHQNEGGNQGHHNPPNDALGAASSWRKPTLNQRSRARQWQTRANRLRQ